MSDIISKLYHSTIQHGKLNDRIYLMHLDGEDKDIIIDGLQEMSHKEGYTKIFAKIPSVMLTKFQNAGYIAEAHIPYYYNGEDDCYIVSKFLLEARKQTNVDELNAIIKVAQSKANNIGDLTLEYDNSLRQLATEDAIIMAEVYQEVFKTYPFPIHDPEYLIDTMNNNVIYYGIFDKDRLVAIASSELNPEQYNAEMTDFAVLPEYRGNNLALVLLNRMEKVMQQMQYKVLYTIARAESHGMNITFSKLGYTYSGTLINNTNISGKIESMNVWYKLLR